MVEVNSNFINRKGWYYEQSTGTMMCGFVEIANDSIEQILHYSELTALCIVDCTLTASNIEQLSQLRKLRYVTFAGSTISQKEQLVGLLQKSAIEVLVLSGTNFLHEEIAILRTHGNCQIYFSETKSALDLRAILDS